MKKLAPEDQALVDIQKKAETDELERVKLEAFRKELDVVLTKYGYLLTATPFINPEGRIGANPNVIRKEDVQV
jgi:hypothetical protein